MKYIMSSERIDQTGYLSRMWMWLLVVMLAAPACSLSANREAPSTPSPTFIPDATNAAFDDLPLNLVRQWAAEAEASSEYVVPEWGAEQAVGPPDAPGCGDYQFAWASAASDSIDTLTLTYETPLYILQIIIHESFNPDQVVKVEILNPEGQYVVVLEKPPEPIDRPCPYQLLIPVDGINFKSDTVRITVDQSVLGLGWNEIDAVELVGVEELPSGE